MLAAADVVQAVAESIRELALPHYVLDPVMVATSGDRLLAGGAERAILELLLPLAELVTPNLDEAALLTESAVRDVEDMERAARQLVAAGAKAALVKGGSTARRCTPSGAQSWTRAARTARGARSRPRWRPAWPGGWRCTRRWRARSTTCTALLRRRRAWDAGTGR
jgi:hydroxymethylpyrimidine kinase/phosphomethylpyrimidine kinase